MPTLGALRYPTFNPSMATLAAVQQAVSPVVVTSFPNTFIQGQYVSFVIPQEYGMVQLNGLTGLITNIVSATGFQINIDTSRFDAFVTPAVPTQSAQAIPAGQLATQFYGTNVNILYNTEYPPYPNPSPQP
jgi:hypothetical protein